MIADDSLIWGQDKEEHNIRRCAILEWKHTRLKHLVGKTETNLLSLVFYIL